MHSASWHTVRRHGWLAPALASLVCGCTKLSIGCAHPRQCILVWSIDKDAREPAASAERRSETIPISDRTNEASAIGLDSIDNVLVFGDSFSDDCNAWRLNTASPDDLVRYPFPICPPAPIGRPVGGQTWAEQLPQFIQERRLNVYIAAHASATCDINIWWRDDIPDIGGQIDMVNQNSFKIDPSRTLSVIFLSGANELNAFKYAFFGKSSAFGESTSSAALLADCYIRRVRKLHDLGYRQQLIFELPALQHVPFFTVAPLPSYEPKLNFTIAQIVQSFKGLLDLEVQHFNFVNNASVEIFPMYRLFRHIINQATANNISTTANCDADDSDYDPRKVNQCNGFVFKDWIHPSHSTSSKIAQEVARYLERRRPQNIIDQKDHKP